MVNEKIYVENDSKEKEHLPMHVKYEGDVDPKKEGDLEREPRRKSSGARNQGIHSAKEADRLSQKISKNYFEKNDVVWDPECIYRNQNVKRKVDQYAYTDTAHKIVNERIYGVNDLKEKNQLPAHVKYEEDVDPEEEGDSEREPPRKSSRSRNQGENSVKEADRSTQNPNVKVEVDQYSFVDETGNVVNEKTCGVNDSKNQVLRMSNRASSKLKLGPDIPIHGVGGSTSYVKPDSERVFRRHDVRFRGDNNITMRKGHIGVKDKINFQNSEDGTRLHGVMNHKSRFLVKNPKSMTVRNSRIKADNEMCPLHRNVKLEDDNYDNMQTSRAPNLRKQRGAKFTRDIKQKVGQLNQTKSSPRRKSMNEAPNVWIEKCSSNEIRKTKAARHFVAYENINSSDAEKCSSGEFRRAKAAKSVMADMDVDNIDAEKASKIESDSDVEIIDEAAFLEKDILNPSASSKKCAKRMKEAGIERLGRPNASDEFRERLLNVLKNPYDQEGYKRHLEAVRGGNYFVYYPDLAGKLTKHRYKKGKRLNILRGFFFWLQNVTLEGSFKPWKDGRCLAVEPPPEP